MLLVLYFLISSWYRFAPPMTPMMKFPLCRLSSFHSTSLAML